MLMTLRLCNQTIDRMNSYLVERRGSMKGWGVDHVLDGGRRCARSLSLSMIFFVSYFQRLDQRSIAVL